MKWAEPHWHQRVVLLLAAALLATALALVAGRETPPAAVDSSSSSMATVDASNSSTTLALFAGPRPDASDPPVLTRPTTSTPGAAASRGGPPPEVASSPPEGRPECRNSFNPACGAFYWDPPMPANTPIALRVTVEPVHAVVGQPLRISLEWSDAEARLGVHKLSTPGACEPREDGSCAPLGGVSTPAETLCPQTPRGPWAPPPVVGTGGFETVRRAYLQPGTYEWTVQISISSGPNEPCHPDPWAEHVTHRGTIVVLPAPATFPTTTTSSSSSTTTPAAAGGSSVRPLSPVSGTGSRAVLPMPLHVPGVRRVPAGRPDRRRLALTAYARGGRRGDVTRPRACMAVGCGGPGVSAFTPETPLHRVTYLWVPLTQPSVSKAPRRTEGRKGGASSIPPLQVGDDASSKTARRALEI